MSVSSIMIMPQTIGQIHESCYQSYHILEKVKEWLRQEVPHAVILELIADMKDPIPELNVESLREEQAKKHQ